MDDFTPEIMVVKQRVASGFDFEPLLRFFGDDGTTTDFDEEDEEYLTGDWQEPNAKDVSFRCKCDSELTEEMILQMVNDGRAKMLSKEEAATIKKRRLN